MDELLHAAKAAETDNSVGCLAGGTDLALNCDLCVAAEEARFGFPAVRSMGSPAAQEFGRIASREGLQAALAWQKGGER